MADGGGTLSGGETLSGDPPLDGPRTLPGDEYGTLSGDGAGEPAGGNVAGPAGAAGAAAETAEWSPDEGLRARDRADAARRAAGDGAPPGYTITGELGRGGMGVVHRARQEGLAREVAVKTLLPGRGAEALAAFRREALLTGRLDHPNIPPIHSWEETREGGSFLAMKLVRGLPWSRLLSPRTESERERAASMDLRAHLQVLRKAADAVAYANDRGIIHRDLKPDNIMVGAFGEVLVMDWGIALDLVAHDEGKAAAKARGGGSPPSPTGAQGTPVYMAPEMTTGDPNAVGAWSDVYLLGGLLYTILTGEAPHEGDGIFAVLVAAREGKVRPPRERAPGREIDEGLAAIAMRALDPDPKRRHPSADAFAAALDDHERGEAARALARAGDREARTARERAAAGALPSEVYGHHGAAVAAFAQALEVTPGAAEIRGRLEAAHVAYSGYAVGAGDLALAEAELSRAPRDTPGAAEVRTRVADIISERDASRARRRRVLLALMALLVLTGVFAAREWRRSAALEEGRRVRARAMNEIAGASWSNDEAKIQAARRATEFDPSWAGGWTDLGRRTYAAVDDHTYTRGLDSTEALDGYRSAIVSFERALALDPSDAAALNEGAYCWALLGEPARALALYRRGAALPGDPLEAVEARGVIALVEGRVDDAYAQFDLCLQRQPQTYYRYERACVLLAKGELDRATADLEALHAEAPRDELYFASLGLAVLASGDLVRGGALLEEGLLVHDAGPRLLPLQAIHAALLGDRPRALAALARARDVQARFARFLSFDPYQEAIAKGADRAARLARAMALGGTVDDLVAERPAESMALVRSAEAALARGDAKEALMQAERALAQNPAEGGAHLVRARVLLSIGAPRDAVRAALRRADLLAPEREAEVRALEAQVGAR